MARSKKPSLVLRFPRPPSLFWRLCCARDFAMYLVHKLSQHFRPRRHDAGRPTFEKSPLPAETARKALLRERRVFSPSAFFPPWSALLPLHSNAFVVGLPIFYFSFFARLRSRRGRPRIRYPRPRGASLPSSSTLSGPSWPRSAIDHLSGGTSVFVCGRACTSLAFGEVRPCAPCILALFSTARAAARWIASISGWRLCGIVARREEHDEMFCCDCMLWGRGGSVLVHELKACGSNVSRGDRRPHSVQ